MEHISDWLTHIENKEDKPFLKTKLFDVNMRLFSTNSPYRAIIKQCCKHIALLALSHFDGYKRPHGTSGANAGIPFNIIAVVRNRGTPNAFAEVMINPKIEDYRGSWIYPMSNCGSIRLTNPIKVKRREGIMLKFFDEDGVPRNSYIDVEGGSLTIQHEVDHNLGILITDRQP